MDWWFCTEQVPKRFCPEGVPSKAQMGGKHLKTYCGINHTAFIPYGTYVILAYPGMNWWSSRCLVMAVMMVIKTMWLSLSVFLGDSPWCLLLPGKWQPFFEFPLPFVWFKKDPMWSCTFRKTKNHWIEIIRTQIQQPHPQNVRCNLLQQQQQQTWQ